MRISRLYLPVPLKTGYELRLEGERAHYLTKVLRLKPDAPAILFNGEGGEYAARILSAAKREVTVEIGEYNPMERESPLQITLALGIARGEKMDYAIQKCTELGAAAIVPLLTKRCGVKLDPKRSEQRLAHWRGVTISACEQSGRNRLPIIHPVTTLEKWLEITAGGLVLSPTADKQLKELEPPCEKLNLLIGPEGGLSEEEIEQAIAAEFKAVTMGPRILRAETAAMAALTAVQVLWGDS